MPKQTRYLLTVDWATGAAVKLERLGEAGDLTEVPLSTLSVPMAGAAPPPAGTASLRHATIVIPDAPERDRLITRLERDGRSLDERDANLIVDPSGNRLLITVA